LEMEFLSGCQETGWRRLEQLPDLEAICSELPAADGPEDISSITRYIWGAIERGQTEGCRKVLVFVPSRALCDRLSLELADAVRQRRDMFVGAHHGSLERSRREQAEREFLRHRDAILVATTTLEVGIDIGDVDAVALVGAPPDTSSLLQRVGRSGRRAGCVRIVPIVRNRLEARAMCSMLDAAYRGALDAQPKARLWSVFVQQAASHIAQAAARGRRRTDLLALAHEVWPEPGGPKTATRVLDSLVERGVFVETAGRLHLGDEWSDRFERGGGDVHNNFDAAGRGIPVVDASTGDVITHAYHPLRDNEGVALAGQRWEVIGQSGEILIKPRSNAGGEETFRYATKGSPMGKSYAEHVRRGLGLGSTDAPVFEGRSGSIWFHFGGTAYEAVLRELYPDLRVARAFRGLALLGLIEERRVRTFEGDRVRLERILEGIGKVLIPAMSLGRYQRELPEDIQSRVALEIFNTNTFVEWLLTREMRRIDPAGATEAKIHEFLSIVGHSGAGRGR
jgi:ATP-dependent helicase Lhr and Lhr-like helicase